MKQVFSLVLVASLAACGADGLPEAPASMDAPQQGVTLSGCAKLGVTVGPAATGGPVRC
jgi:hypothetical protein